MALAPVGGSDVGTDQYTLEGSRSDYELKAGNQLVPIEEVSVVATKYGVAFTFNVTRQTFQTDGAAALASEKAAQVNALAEYRNVVALRWEQDQGTDGNLYNYMVVTVGTPDGLITTDVRIRMDQIGSPSAFAAIDAAWKNLQSLGA